MLTWSAVIPTYNREPILLQCLRLLAQQTQPPKEVIIIDASPNWQQLHPNLIHTCTQLNPHINWQHHPAQQLSSATQRNQGIAKATADILFLIDDDTFLYPDCAQQIMAIYELDTQQQFIGIMPGLVPLPPPLSTPNSPHSPTPPKPSKNWQSHWKTLHTRARSYAKRWIGDHAIFIPYHFEFPRHPFPPHLREKGIHPVPLFHGARMTFRRKIFQHLQFEDLFIRYAVNEDNDLCYRASQLGLLVQFPQAQVCHIQAGTARLSRFTATVLWGLNQAVLHRLHSPDPPRFQHLFRKLLWKRLLTQTLKDLLDRRWSLPSTRGILFILRHFPHIFNKTPETLRPWYLQFQHQLLEQDRHLPARDRN